MKPTPEPEKFFIDNGPIDLAKRMEELRTGMSEPIGEVAGVGAVSSQRSPEAISDGAKVFVGEPQPVSGGKNEWSGRPLILSADEERLLSGIGEGAVMRYREPDPDQPGRSLRDI